MKRLSVLLIALTLACSAFAAPVKHKHFKKSHGPKWYELRDHAAKKAK